MGSDLTAWYNKKRI